jgi:predicted transposase YdaD
MGLCYSEELVSRLLEGVQNMQESTTYQAILREGRNEGLIEGRVSEAQRLLALLGEARFVEADETTRGTIEAIRDLERLERISKRVVDPGVHDWGELLGLA